MLPPSPPSWRDMPITLYLLRILNQRRLSP